MPYCAEIERTIPLSRSYVFAALADFGAVGDLLPDLIDSVEIKGEGIGAERRIQINASSGYPGLVVERLDTEYDGRVFSYSIVGDSPMPMTEYVAVVRFEDTPGGGCLVHYGSNWEPRGLSAGEVKELLEGLYGQILDAIVKRAS